MPTYEWGPRFARDWARLPRVNQGLFLKVIHEAFAVDLDAADQPFRPGLRVKGVSGHAGVFEMTWAPDGRATFCYGESKVLGKAHIIWRRIGTHSIFTPPPGP